MTIKWTEKEEKYLIENYSELDTEVMSKNLDKSINAIYKKSMRMGLKKITRHRNVEPFSLTDIDAAYLAGVMDCDGHFGLARRKYPMMKISMTTREVADWFSDLVGRTTVVGKYEWNGIAYPIYHATAQKLALLIKVIKRIMPYLKTKKCESQILLDYAEKLFKSTEPANRKDGMEVLKSLQKIREKKPIQDV